MCAFMSPVQPSPANDAVRFDDTLKLLTLSYSGFIMGQDIIGDIIAHTRRIADPWLYDIIIDFSDFEGTVLTSDMENLAARWNAVAQGRDHGRLSALVSTDALFKARMPLRKAAFPLRTVRLFATFAEAHQWIIETRSGEENSLAS
jgi:hypothetical protein